MHLAVFAFRDGHLVMQAVKGDLLKEPSALMCALATNVWANPAPAATAQLMLLLSLFEDCLTVLVGEHASPCTALHHFSGCFTP